MLCLVEIHHWPVTSVRRILPRKANPKSDVSFV